MIEVDKSMNMGGIAQIELVKACDILNERMLNGQAVAVLPSTLSPVSVYFTQYSASLAFSLLANNLYAIKFNFKSPVDSLSLFNSLYPYIGESIVMFVKFSNGTTKTFGTKSCPLKITSLPNQQSAATDFNGFLVYAESADFLPGRYGTYENISSSIDIDYFNTFPWGHEEVSSIDYGSGKEAVSDFALTNVKTDNNKLVLDIKAFASDSASCSFSRTFKDQTTVDHFIIDFDSYSFNSFDSAGVVLSVQAIDSVGETIGDYNVVPIKGRAKVFIKQNVWGYKLTLSRTTNNLRHFVRINSIGWE
ncbi:MAG: hypothetical protein PHI03_12620 [Bacteroidales bacterium]|nr:hypothetical protein [Bacteroidales bacterium]MDD4673768.1 hypothetical protein [Bacteroidales bacterium]